MNINPLRIFFLSLVTVSAQKTGIKIILNHPIPHPPIMQRSMPRRT